jgi:hypothetical protein
MCTLRVYPRCELIFLSSSRLSYEDFLYRDENDICRSCIVVNRTISVRAWTRRRQVNLGFCVTRRIQVTAKIMLTLSQQHER